MPKRILNLADNRVSLQEGARPNRYACLSHCWGKSNPPVKTVKATIEGYKKDIPWQMLSKTFQDAVDICRRLGVEYLWIDSLCIIQDSKQDWNQEAMKMGDIYSHAHFTIAATASEDGSGGCYRDRDPINVKFYTVIEDSVYLGKNASVLYPGLYYNLGYERTTPPLLRRAWVFQEMLLSRRVIHFTETEVIWQCNTCVRSESKIDGELSYPGFRDYNATPGKDLMVEGKCKGKNAWRELVSEYSGLQMSFESDRLPALAAVSQRTDQLKAIQRIADHELRDDRFLAGLWLNSLFIDLLWMRYSLVYPRIVKRETGCGMPSWSWASLQEKVEWDSFTSHGEPLGCVSLVAANVVPIESPYLGKYSRAELVLKGPVIHTTLGSLEGDKDDRWFYPDVELLDSQLALLPLAMSDTYHTYIHFLVLRPREDRRTYERVGVLQQEFVDIRLKIDQRLSRSAWIKSSWFRRGNETSFRMKRVESYLSQFPKEEVIIT